MNADVYVSVKPLRVVYVVVVHGHIRSSSQSFPRTVWVQNMNETFTAHLGASTPRHIHTAEEARRLVGSVDFLASDHTMANAL